MAGAQLATPLFWRYARREWSNGIGPRRYGEEHDRDRHPRRRRIRFRRPARRRTPTRFEDIG